MNGRGEMVWKTRKHFEMQVSRQQDGLSLFRGISEKEMQKSAEKKRKNRSLKTRSHES